MVYQTSRSSLITNHCCHCTLNKLNNSINNNNLCGLPNFTIVTDQKPLLPLYDTCKKDPPVRILKHKTKPQGNNFNFIYEPGSPNAADYLSLHKKSTSGQLTTVHTKETELFVNAVVTSNLPDANVRRNRKSNCHRSYNARTIVSNHQRLHIDKGTKSTYVL